MSIAQATNALPEQADLGRIIEAYSDVTERLKHSHELLRDEVRRLREQLDEKNRELERRKRLAALGEMAAGVAHEIRNPLAGIGLFASLLERDLADRPKERGTVRQILTGVRNLESIVCDTLAFARGADPRVQDVALCDILHRVLTQTAPQAHAQGIQVEVDSTLAGVRLRCDSTQIERALLNLLFNALDAAGEAGRVCLRPAEVEQAEQVGIAVEDSGPGVPEAQRDHIFDPFFSTKDSGTGLGLAIVHRIAETHGGSVRVATSETGGASFVLALPRSTAALQDTEVELAEVRPPIEDRRNQNGQR